MLELRPRRTARLSFEPLRWMRIGYVCGMSFVRACD